MTDMNVPAEVRSLAKVEGLGDLRGVHDPRSVDRRARAWLVILGLPGLVLLPFALAFLSHGIGWASFLSTVLTSVYLGAAGRILVRDVLPGYGRTLYVYEHGLVLKTRRGSTAFPWDKVREVRVSGVRHGSPDTVTWRLGLVREDGEEAELGGEFPGVRDVVETVSAAVTERLLPKYISRLEEGGTIRLGPFTVSREGIVKGGIAVPWDYVDGVAISNGMVWVNRADRLSGLTATAGEVPNAVAFGELARHVLRNREDPSRTVR